MRIENDALLAVKKGVLEEYAPRIRHVQTRKELDTLASHIHAVWGDIPGYRWGQSSIDIIVAKRRFHLLYNAWRTSLAGILKRPYNSNNNV